MALVSISEAARLTGKNRTTIYKYIDRGKLSIIVDNSNKSKIDVSELERVFGELKDINNRQQEYVNNSQKETTENAVLKKEIEHLKEIILQKNELIEEKEKRNQDLKEAMLMLENKLSTQSHKKVDEEEKLENIKKSKKKWWKLW